ncbi:MULTISPECIES: MBL fold metallo-hydrolase [Ensifer]|jgi:phosphoribosyl 1,2-cyclic phosphodiesterase|uniref:MBL fold metallo-hydrolase n=1 Tax=Ensifer adhaerens TaxID=106592 RepID=A0A9Q8YEF7_ENSAD|nr:MULTISPECIES: MBL fold metallo-hydrolase [Ensifer]OWZ93831.1 MBL fold metallo-hydrolase [Sinorhizobium sp. LM21]MBD9497103.1 MBL fold metallo-hydrolase [Ensifer sp. ENS01]MBD9540705.1 MBL fold metallo-hydrolase [Ensifer sp. ENS04]OKP76310.1 MBL fold metallo-hydrolase [Ensifer adhaerens]QHG73576.1 MBL fold metallo-hydrolase [Ensifer adhaerens]
MRDDNFRVRFWGVRGSLPVSGQQYVAYGGNTSCIEIRCGKDVLLFDAGSGLREAGYALIAEGVEEFDLFFTHSHYDHIIGLPYFKPIYKCRNSVRFWSGHLHGTMTTREMIRDFMRPPWFPVDPDICQASLDGMDFKPGDVLTPRAGVTIRTMSLNHPGGCVGYRIEWNGRAVALVYDTEHEPGVLDPGVLELIAGAELFVYDCTYLESEMEHFQGYGHSTGMHGARLAMAAGVKQLAMFHHDPSRTDEALAAMERDVQATFPGAFAARDGQIVELD